MSTTKGFDKLIAYYKTKSNAARALGVTRQAVDHWRKHGVSAEAAIKFEEITGGHLTAKQLVAK